MAAHNFICLCLLAPLVLLAPAAHAEDAAPSGISSAIKRSGLPVPRFASLRSDTVNMRVGPGARYPVVWVFKRKGLPVEIIAEFDTWRKIRDPSGDEGWVHQATLSGKRSFMVTARESQPLYRKKETDSTLKGELKPGVQGRVSRCWDEWCKVEVEGLSGYIKKTGVWGIYPAEKFD